MGYESYFRDPHLKREADKIINRFMRLKKTLVSINIGLKNINTKMAKMIVNLKSPDVNEILVEEYKNSLFDIASDMYGLIEKADSIIMEMKTNYFSKSPKLEFKNRELLQEHEEIKRITLKTYEDLKKEIDNAIKKINGDNDESDNTENTGKSQ